MTQFLLNKNKKDLAEISAKTNENKSRDRSSTNTEPVAESTSELEAPNSELSKQGIASDEDVVNSIPESWSIEQVAQWLSSINLEEHIEKFRVFKNKVIILPIVLENEIDGSLLMSDGLDDTLLKELIPPLKYRIIFNNERKKLRSRQQQKSTISTANTIDIHVKLKSTDTSKMELLSSKNNNQFLGANATQNKDIQSCKTLPAVWDEVKQHEIQSILKQQEELRTCYDNYPDIDDIVNRETVDIKSADELTRSILSKLPSGNVAETDTLCHVINNLIENGKKECLFFDSRQGVDLHDASTNLADLSVTDKPFVLKLHNSDDFLNKKDSKDEQHGTKLIKTLNRVIEQKQSHPIIDDILERLSKAHNIDKKNILLKNVYLGSFNIVYTVMDLATNIYESLIGLSRKLNEQFKQFKAAKIHPLLYRPSFDIAQFDARGNKTFSHKEGTFEVGPPGRTKSYIQPAGWTRYGLKVLGRYTNDEWLDPFGHPGNWYRAFHGTGNAKAVDFSNSNASFDAQYAPIDAASSIHKTGFREARVNIHGPGVYCSPKPSFVENGYAGVAKLDTKIGTKTFKIMLQVAVNPDGVKFATEDIWIAKNSQDIRTYGILIKEV
ncbi:unnamed protein product [Rotaria sordida]|uniref:SAM domain-containing protein n=1 Tax=Rotaria sordida TaxID=392033 RepID=A0A819HF66_9BILA|nr:unnamed protein product [Rotaria sordida]CAF4069229.1 unnamed protein product [Rotaria sordida]